jgi:hypothetical protein
MMMRAEERGEQMEETRRGESRGERGWRWPGGGITFLLFRLVLLYGGNIGGKMV